MGDVAIIGSNPTRIWGMSASERIARMAGSMGLAVAGVADAPRVLANSAFAFDPAWLRYIAARPNSVLTLGGVPVLAHAGKPGQAVAIHAAVARGAQFDLSALHAIAAEDHAAIRDAGPHRRTRPFVMRLTPETARAAERASYFAAYHGITDLLTKYLWPEGSLLLTRLAARLGIGPGVVVLTGVALCAAAAFAFLEGRYWTGISVGVGFMLLDIVDGRLARCTFTGSRLAGLLDRATDLVHPPLWWWAWGQGLAAYGTPLPRGTLFGAIVAVFAAYAVDRLIERAFAAGFGMSIHVWRPIDSRFRLIAARRNPNMLILVAALCFRRPDLGLLALAWWSVASCAFHLVRFAQACVLRLRGRPPRSWLDG